MMKKRRIVALLCVFVLLLACPFAGPVAGAEEDDDGLRYYEDSTAGIRFRLPDVWYTAMYEKPRLTGLSYACGFSFDYHSEGSLAAFEKLYGAPLPEDEADYSPEQKAFQEAFYAGIVPLCGIAAEKEGQRDEEIRGLFPAETPLGEKDGTVYTLLTNPDVDLSKLSESEKAEYQALLAATADFAKDMTLSGVREVNFDGMVSFDSQTIDGTKMDSSCFQGYTLTMVNIWATWCGPCVGELPELQELYENLPEGTNLLGICTDGAEEAETAQYILDEVGVKYPNISANEEMLNGFVAAIQSYPTTLFVDGDGNIVGEPISGAPSEDVVETYLAEMQSRLALLGK